MSHPPPSPEASAIAAKLHSEGVDYLYHWTSVENLPNIRKMAALCSKEILKDRGLWLEVDPGGNELSHSLDESLGNFDKVALNFTPHTPMVFNRKKDIGNQIYFFIIRATVATWQGVVFTNTNAAKPGHQRDSGMAGLGLVNFEAVKAHPFEVEDWVKLVQAEVLVPNCIALDQIERVVFVSEASCREAERLWESFPHPSFEVAREYFASNFRDTTSISFPYLDRFYLVEDGASEPFAGPSISLRREPASNVYFEAHLQAQTGTTLRMELQPVDKSFVKQYQRRDRYRARPYLSTDSLPAGAYSVECYLDDIRWARLDFELTD